MKNDDWRDMYKAKQNKRKKKVNPNPETELEQLNSSMNVYLVFMWGFVFLLLCGAVSTPDLAFPFIASFVAMAFFHIYIMTTR